MSAAENAENTEIVGVATRGEAQARAEAIRADMERVGEWLSLVALAYAKRDWAALGYASWDAYLDGELGGDRMQLPREVRRQAVAFMRGEGMSIRAIAAATGAGRGTIQRDLSGVPSGTPDTTSSDKFTERFGVPPATARVLVEDVDQAELPDGDDRVRIAEEMRTALPTVAGDVPEVPSNVIGIDGKRYSAPAPKPKNDPPKSKRRPLPDAAFEAAYDMHKKAESLERLRTDERFAANRDTVRARAGRDVLETFQICRRLLVDLGIEEPSL